MAGIIMRGIDQLANMKLVEGNGSTILFTFVRILITGRDRIKNLEQAPTNYVLGKTGGTTLACRS